MGVAVNDGYRGVYVSGEENTSIKTHTLNIIIMLNLTVSFYLRLYIVSLFKSKNSKIVDDVDDDK